MDCHKCLYLTDHWKRGREWKNYDRLLSLSQTTLRCFLSDIYLNFWHIIGGQFFFGWRLWPMFGRAYFARYAALLDSWNTQMTYTFIKMCNTKSTLQNTVSHNATRWLDLTFWDKLTSNISCDKSVFRLISRNLTRERHSDLQC